MAAELIYEYEIGNEPSAGRAIGHGVMDVLTLGIWEVVGTTIESFQGEKRRMKITFDENDYVVSIGSNPIPKKEPVQKKQENGAVSIN